jgi:hypothetical protein
MWSLTHAMKNRMFIIAVASAAVVNTVTSEPIPYKNASKAICEFTEPFYRVTVDFKARSMTISSVGEFVTDRGEAISKRTDVFLDVLIAESEKGTVIISYVSKVFPEKKPVELLKIATQERGSDGMSDKKYTAAAYSFLHARVEHGGCNFVK